MSVGNLTPLVAPNSNVFVYADSMFPVRILLPKGSSSEHKTLRRLCAPYSHLEAVAQKRIAAPALLRRRLT